METIGTIAAVDRARGMEFKAVGNARSGRAAGVGLGNISCGAGVEIKKGC